MQNKKNKLSIASEIAKCKIKKCKIKNAKQKNNMRIKPIPYAFFIIYHG
jgi:hypothetical protein